MCAQQPHVQLLTSLAHRNDRKYVEIFGIHSRTTESGPKMLLLS